MTTSNATSSPTSYAIPADQMQAIVNTLASLPWGQVNNILTPLMATIQQQEKAAAGAGAGTGA